MEDEPKEINNKIIEENNKNSEVNNIINQENNNEMKKETNEESIKNNGIKKQNKPFIIKYIIFVAVLIILTAGACYFTIINQNNNEIEEILEEKIEEVTQAKQKAEDSIYAITSYTETYNENPITIEELFYKNGEVYKEWPEGNANSFIKISGLMNKSVEEKINKKFKDVVEEWKNIGTSSYVYVAGNFSNILSVEMYYHVPDSNNVQIKTFNIDLNTGEEIPFEKVFVESAPIKAMLIEDIFQNLSWVNKRTDDTVEDWEDAYNMDNVDTSDYEDKALMVARNYEKKKDEIKYLISPTTVTVYDLMDNNIIPEEFYHNHIYINLYKYKEEVAIYKRYLKNENIYEDNSIGLKNIIVFTNLGYAKEYNIINYGKISDNVFLEEGNAKGDEKNNITEKFIAKKVKEFNEKIVNETPQDKGMICQMVYGSHNYYDYKYKKYTDEYFVVSFETHTATCSKEYFKENIFKDYIKMKACPSVGVALNFFEEYSKDEFPNLTIKQESNTYYLDKDGNIVATSYEEMDKLIEKRFMEEQQQYESELLESLQEDAGTETENYNNNLQPLIGEYTDAPDYDINKYSAKLVISNVTDSSFDFHLYATSEVDVEDIIGTATKVAERQYYFNGSVTGAPKGFYFEINPYNDNVGRVKVYLLGDQDYEPEEESMYFVGCYRKIP